MQTKIEIQPCPVVIAVPMRLWPVHHVCLQCTTPLLLQGRHQLTQGVACSKLYSTAAIQTTLFPAAWIVAGPVIVIDLHHTRPHHCNAVEKGRRPQKNYSHIASLQTQILLNTSVSLRMSTLQCMRQEMICIMNFSKRMIGMF